MTATILRQSYFNRCCLIKVSNSSFYVTKSSVEATTIAARVIPRITHYYLKILSFAFFELRHHPSRFSTSSSKHPSTSAFSNRHGTRLSVASSLFDHKLRYLDSRAHYAFTLLFYIRNWQLLQCQLLHWNPSG